MVFADDSGLEVDALGGAPGIYSARYAGDHAGDLANNELLLRNMAGQENRKARFVCVVALAQKGALIRTFRGEVEGEILDAPRGIGGFGYDPLFYFPPFGQAFGEAAADRKFAVSHRGKALLAMADYLKL
jgi:XTP/dITP diphosphohydrolase